MALGMGSFLTPATGEFAWTRSGTRSMRVMGILQQLEQRSRLVQGGFASSIFRKARDHSVTVKLVALVVVPAGVVIAIVPVSAPSGTIAVSFVLDFTVKVVASMPSKVTFVVCVRLTPVMVTVVPTGPLFGVKLLICGVASTLKITIVFSVPLGVTTVT